MKLTYIAAFLSTAIAIYCTVPYIISILKRRTQPHQLSWLVFTIMNGIVFFSQYFSGGRQSVLISLTFFIGSLLIFLLSLQYGMRNTSRWDKALFVFALVTIVIWFVTRSNALAIWLTLLIDVFATSMIILKVKSEPRSEDPYPWILAASAYVFALFTLAGRPLDILYVRPLYGLVGDVLLIIYIYYCRTRKRDTGMEVSPTQT
jgi:hypothetical protein